jgi:hypothetical protein
METTAADDELSPDELPQAVSPVRTKAASVEIKNFFIHPPKNKVVI